MNHFSLINCDVTTAANETYVKCPKENCDCAIYVPMGMGGYAGPLIRCGKCQSVILAPTAFFGPITLGPDYTGTAITGITGTAMSESITIAVYPPATTIGVVPPNFHFTGPPTDDKK